MSESPERHAIDRRISGIEEWLRENAPEVTDEQRHLDTDSVERAYWHYGYLVALRDVRKLLGGAKARLS